MVIVGKRNLTMNAHSIYSGKVNAGIMRKSKMFFIWSLFFVNLITTLLHIYSYYERYYPWNWFRKNE